MTKSSVPNRFSTLRVWLRVFSLFFVLMAAGLSGRVRAQSIDLSLPADIVVTGRDTVYIPIELSDVSGLNLLSFEFTISFDPEIIQIPGLSATGYLADDFLIIPNASNEGRIVVAGAANDRPLRGDGTLLTLSAVFQKEGNSDLTFESFKFDESNALTLNLGNGHIRNEDLKGPGSQKDPITPEVFVRGNYPNPFRSATRIVMDLPKPAQVRVQVFNVYGQLVRTYSPRALNAGANQQFLLDASSLPAGLYLYRLEASGLEGTQTASGTMTIIH